MNKTAFYTIAIVIVLFILFSSFKSVDIIDITKKLPTKRGGWGKRNLSVVTDITVHHGASANNATPYDYASYHVNNKDWNGIGYHFVIARDGTIFQTNALDSLSWHNGFNNSRAIGVCLVGNMKNEPMTIEQTTSLFQVIKHIKNKVPSVRRLIGHKEYAGKTACPGRFTNMNYFRSKTGLQGTSKNFSIYEKQIYYNPLHADN